MAIGKNPTLPSSSQDDLPALEGHTSSPVIAQHLNVITVARQAFLEADLSLKLRGALKHRVRLYSDAVQQQNDIVFYKLPGENRWQGPAVIIGQGKKAVIVKHGSTMRRVHPFNLQLKDKGEIIVSAVNDDVTNK